MMNKTEPIKIFVDNCIISLSETMQGTYKEQEFVWGEGETVHCKIQGWKRKSMPGKNETWERKQIECLPTIGRMAREKQILLYTYSELRHEALRRNATNKFGNVFKDVEITYVNAAVERSYFFPGELSSYISKEESKLIEFCKWLLELTFDDINIVECPPKLKAYPEFLLNNLKNVERFHELCRGLTENQYPDAFHLWSAEVNGANFFLTIDNIFINVMTQTKNIDLPCPPISPEDLLTELNISERDPFEFQEGIFYNYCGKPTDK